MSHEEDGRSQAYYEALLNAWIATRMEKDRTVVTLSAGGVALLVTLLTATSLDTGLELALTIVSFLGFLAAIFSGITVLRRDADHLERLLRERTSSDPRLRQLDRLLFWGFTVGVVSAVATGIMEGLRKLGG